MIELNSCRPPLPVPPGYRGPIWLSDTGRMVWWTGRVAIGLRHERAWNDPLPVQWVQRLMMLCPSARGLA